MRFLAGRVGQEKYATARTWHAEHVRVDGVDRPWWWSPGSPWLAVGMPLLVIADFVTWLQERSTFVLFTWIALLLLTLVRAASLIATRRRLEWERREF